MSLPGASATPRVPAAENPAVDALLAQPDARALRALATLPDLGADEHQALAAGLYHLAEADARVAALQVLALYWADQDAAAGVALVPESTETAVVVIRDALARLPEPASVAAVWEVLAADAVELVDLRLHQLAGTTPRYCVPGGGQAEADRNAMKAEVEDLTGRVRRLSARLAGVVPT